VRLEAKALRANVLTRCLKTGVVAYTHANGICLPSAGRTCFDLFVVLSEAAFVDPNVSDLAGIDCRGVIVTRAGGEGEGFDFVSRFFAPRCVALRSCWQAH
jgi:hypothetical protein